MINYAFLVVLEYLELFNFSLGYISSQLSPKNNNTSTNPSINLPAFLHLASRAPSHACRARCDGVMTSSNNVAA